MQGLYAYMEEKVRIKKTCLCAFCSKECVYQRESSTPGEEGFQLPYRNIILCLNCPVLRENISQDLTLSKFFEELKNQLLALQQKIDLDQMILNKQKSSLNSIKRSSEGHIEEQNRQERELKGKINRYSSLLSKRDEYLHTLQKLSDITGSGSKPKKIWESSSALMIENVSDLEAIGLLIMKKNHCMIDRQFIDLLPTTLSNYIDRCFDHETYCSRMMNTQICISLYHMYWESRGNPNRLGPRTEELLERCFLFPIKGAAFLKGVFVVLMKNLTSSTEELTPFFCTAGRLIEEGIMANA